VVKVDGYVIREKMNALKTTLIYEKIATAFDEKKRHIWIQGGTAASKTWSALQFLYLLNAYTKTPLLTSIVSETVPHIKRGCLRDFRNILGDVFHEDWFNKTDLIYHFPNSTIEFFGADQSDKLRGARRDVLFVNEVNNLSYDAFRELDARTRLCTIADWNPVSEFFFHQNNLGDDPDSAFIHATYRDALQVVAPEVIKNILAMGKQDSNWANVYIHGRIGRIEGLIYPHFTLIDELPGEFEWQRYGVDFGYENPTTCVFTGVMRNTLYLDEVLYQTHLTNADLIQYLKALPQLDIYADSAEPQRIEEICRAGLRCYPAFKDVQFGLDAVKRYDMMVTKRSVNLIKELRGYQRKRDKDNRILDEPVKINDHTMDAIRYSVVGGKPARPLMIG